MENKAKFQTTTYTSRIESTTLASKLEVRYSDKRGRDGQIIDPRTSTPIYNVRHRYRKPTFALESASTGLVLATACSSKWTMRMAMDIQGQKFDLTPKKKLGSDCTYSSPAFGNQTITWELTSDGGYQLCTCLDQSGSPIAYFRGPSTTGCSMVGSFGEFDFVEGQIESEAQRDEIVATGLTLAYKAVMNRTASRTVVVV